jgi:hypothetical protein
MTKPKRVSDHQLCKDTDDAGTEERHAETPGPSLVPARASQRALQHRIRELNERLLREVAGRWEQQRHAADYSPLFQEYLEQAETMGREHEEGSEGKGRRVAKAAAPGAALGSLSLDDIKSSGTFREAS